MVEISHPYNWWFSGRFWYCNVRLFGTERLVRVSGSGMTKEEAAYDARLEMERKIGSTSTTANKK